MDSTTMKGTVLGYFDRAFDELTDKELETPTARPSIPAPPYQRFRPRTLTALFGSPQSTGMWLNERRVPLPERMPLVLSTPPISDF